MRAPSPTRLARAAACAHHGGQRAWRQVDGQSEAAPLDGRRLSRLREEPEGYEFVDGIVRMMTGGSAAHSAIKNNVTNTLNAALRDGPSRAYVDDLKVVTATAVMYPDVVIACAATCPRR